MQVFLADKDDGLPLVIDELVDVFSLKLVDELDEVTVTMLDMVLGAQVCQLILAVDVVDADLALHQFLHEKIKPQRDMLCARNVGTVARRCAAPTCYRYAVARCRSSHRSPAPISCWSRMPPHPSLPEPPPRALPPSWTVWSAPVVSL